MIVRARLIDVNDTDVPGTVSDLVYVSQEDGIDSVTVATAAMPGTNGAGGDTLAGYRLVYRDDAQGPVTSANVATADTIKGDWQSAAGMTPGSAQQFTIEIGHFGTYWVAAQFMDARGVESAPSNNITVTFLV